MKRLILWAIIGLFMGLNANAQVAYQENLKYSFGGVFKDSNGVKLSKEDLQNYFDAYQYADYVNASRKFKSGAIVLGVGVGSVALAYASYAAMYKDVMTADDDDWEYSVGNILGFTALGNVLICGGLVCVVVGIPIMLVQNHKLMDIAKDYNRKQNISLNFGLQQHGVGFALNF